MFPPPRLVFDGDPDSLLSEAFGGLSINDTKEQKVYIPVYGDPSEPQFIPVTGRNHRDSPNHSPVSRRNRSPLRNASPPSYESFRARSPPIRKPSPPTYQPSRTRSPLRNARDSDEEDFPLISVAADQRKLGEEKKEITAGSERAVLQESPAKEEEVKCGGEGPKLNESYLYQAGPKGFENRIGENNCFLNVVLQSLFLLPPFATEFAAMEIDESGNRVYSALKEIFIEYQFDERSEISPKGMRKVLSDIFAPESRFALNKIDDANEVLVAILDLLHNEMTKGASADGDCNCLVHRVFGMGFCTLSQCEKCHATSDPEISNEWVIYSQVMAIIDWWKNKDRSFEHCIRDTMFDVMYSCPADKPCKDRTAKRHKYLMKRPPIMSLCFSWPSVYVKEDVVEAFIKLLPLEIDVKEIFDNESTSMKHVIRGIVCFYGCHYVLLFMSRDKKEPDFSNKIWYKFDDTRVTKIGVWINVKEFLLKNHYRPTLVFYVHQ